MTIKGPSGLISKRDSIGNGMKPLSGSGHVSTMRSTLLRFTKLAAR
jgi:hypothetical protein